VKLGRINIIGLLVCLLVSISVNAQKESLKELCKGINSLVNSEDGLHIEYDMIMMGRGAEYTEPESMKISYFKDGTKGFHINQGGYQETLRKGNKVLMINHIQKQVVFQVDTTEFTNTNDLLKQLSTLVEASSSVDSIIHGDSLIYKLSFNNHPMYSKVDFTFSKKEKTLLVMHCVFKENYPEPYKYLRVVYTLWETDWKAYKGFPNINKYVVKKNGKLTAGEAVLGYSVFAPEIRTLNIDLSK
tara:strand:+ start:76 stop:807 length:732 start_codon:yes stop_codon:yes gene_type:complete